MHRYVVDVIFTLDTPSARDITAPYFSRIKTKAFSREPSTHGICSSLFPAWSWRLNIYLSIIYLSLLKMAIKFCILNHFLQIQSLPFLRK